LVLAVFLAIAGVTGSLISFDDELDALLNPSWFRSDERGTVLSPSALVGHRRLCLVAQETVSTMGDRLGLKG
jgi:uncharacterized iron-regulated membrane protein